MRAADRSPTVSLLLALATASCAGSATDSRPLAADVPLHLEEVLEAAEISGSGAPGEQPLAEWVFADSVAGWQPVRSTVAPYLTVPVVHARDAIRIDVGEANRRGPNSLVAAVYVDVPDWTRDEWDHLLIRARATGGLRAIQLAFNLGPREVEWSEEPVPIQSTGESAFLIRDGAVHTYRLRIDWSPAAWGEWEDRWRQLILFVRGPEPGAVELVSVRAVSKAAAYGDAPAGVRALARQGASRRALYMHAPGQISYRVTVPPEGRLDFGAGVLRAEDRVTFRVRAAPPGVEQEPLFEETYADAESWGPRSVDLAHLAGETVDVVLEAESDREGAVALWSAPTLSGSRLPERPNVILYAVDGLGAEYMSLYGFNLRTTPNLERLAEEGAVFEHAYSNARWTTPGTVALMTSLQHSVLGGFQRERVELPGHVVTMAQHFHRAGYQTAVLTGNPSAASTAGLGREVDFLRDRYVGDASSVTLQGQFWDWRESFPGQPYWVHFQMTDVWFPGGQEFVGPFAGLYVPAARRNEFMDWRSELRRNNLGHWWRPTPEMFETAGIDRIEYSETGQALYGEAIAHQDWQIGRFVEQLEAAGEWENTIFIVTADHGQHEAGLVMVDPPIPDGHHTHLRPEHTWIPLLVVWPGHIPGGARFRDPVSLIDVLPTLLELVGLPPAEVAQGRSLAPLLLGQVSESEWEPRPVILDEFYVDPESGELQGWIEVVDGRWGASLEINPPVRPGWARRGEYDDAQGERPAPLLLYDLWQDPYCLSPVNDEHPERVVRYTSFLEAQFEAHRALSRHVGAAGAEVVLTPEQLESLRSLGYIQD